MGGAHGPATGVNQHALAGLRVLQLQEADRRQLLLARVADAHRDQVVTAAGALQGLLEVAVEEVAQQENDGPAVEHAVEVVEPLAEAGAAPLRLEEEDVADQAEDVADALARRDELLDAVGQL